MNSDNKLITTCLLTLTVTSIAAVLALTKTVSVPFVFSLFMFAIISPFMRYLQLKLKISKTISLILTALIFIVVSSTLSILVIDSFGNFLQQTTSYSAKIKSATIAIAATIESYGIEFPKEKVVELIQNLPFFNWFRSLSGSLFFIIGNFFLVSVFTFFLLMGDAKASTGQSIFTEIKGSISNYVNTKLFLSLLTGLLLLVLFLVFSVDLAFMFALIAIFLNFIPTLGSIIATLLPTPVLFLQFGFGVKFWAILIISSVLQIIIGQIIEPKLMGENIGLHPVAILFFLTFWGFIWGIPGMFLAVPITATMKIVLKQFELTKPVSSLLEGRWEF